MKQNKISLIIIHWNTSELLRKQLSRLDHQQFEIVVIDNNSNDKPGWITDEFPKIIYIQNKINKGYAAACNQGTAIAKGEWLLFLNPDVEITSKQIEMMLSEVVAAGLDACSPKPESKDYQKPVPSWWNLLQEFTPMNRFTGRDGNNGVSTLTGGCLLIKATVLKSLGGWDERFFVWFEDSDLTQRLINNHYKIGWIENKISHIGGVSFKNLNQQTKRDIFFHSMDVYAHKHFSLLGQLIISYIKNKYTKRKILPALNPGTSITVPNMKPDILETFFQNNSEYIKKIDELIVVTSGIGDSDIWTWRNKYPYVRFIVLKNNQGVASTINTGLRASTGQWIGTVNDDTILSSDWIETCLECDTHEVGVLNPLIYHPDGIMESAGVTVLKKGQAFPIKVIPSNNKCIEADAVNGAIVLYKNEALNRAGIFDERFGSYLEDIDLSLRIKRNGFKNIICLQTRVTHIGHATSTQTIWKIKPMLDFRNWIYVIIKNWSVSDLLFNFPIIIIERMKNISGILKALK